MKRNDQVSDQLMRIGDNNDSDCEYFSCNEERVYDRNDMIWLVAAKNAQRISTQGRQSTSHMQLSRSSQDSSYFSVGEETRVSVSLDEVLQLASHARESSVKSTNRISQNSKSGRSNSELRTKCSRSLPLISSRVPNQQQRKQFRPYQYQRWEANSNHQDKHQNQLRIGLSAINPKGQNSSPQLTQQLDNNTKHADAVPRKVSCLGTSQSINPRKKITMGISKSTSAISVPTTTREITRDTSSMTIMQSCRSPHGKTGRGRDLSPFFSRPPTSLESALRGWSAACSESGRERQTTASTAPSRFTNTQTRNHPINTSQASQSFTEATRILCGKTPSGSRPNTKTKSREIQGKRQRVSGKHQSSISTSDQGRSGPVERVIKQGSKIGGRGKKISAVLEQSSFKKNNDGWEENEINFLNEAMGRIPAGVKRYWELISQALEPRYHRTPQECSRKAIRLEEEKIIARSTSRKNEKELSVLAMKTQLPSKGNTRGWKMNQLIKKMAFKDKSGDLLGTAFGLHKCDASKSNDQRFLSIHKTQEQSSSHNISANSCIPCGLPAGSDEGRNGVLTSEHLSNGKNSSTSYASSRQSIPSWIMTPNQLELLSTVHTGLTPRHNKDDKQYNKDDEKHTRFGKKGSRKGNILEMQKPSGAEDEDDYESNDDDNEDEGCTNRFAGDVLGRVELCRTLQHQRLIDRHKKKLISTNQRKCIAIESRAKSTISHHIRPTSRFDIFEAQQELKSVLGNHETEKLRQQKRDIVDSLRWTKENAELEDERNKASDELNCFLDRSDDEEMLMIDDNDEWE